MLFFSFTSSPVEVRAQHQALAVEGLVPKMTPRTFLVFGFRSLVGYVQWEWYGCGKLTIRGTHVLGSPWNHP